MTEGCHKCPACPLGYADTAESLVVGVCCQSFFTTQPADKAYLVVGEKAFPFSHGLLYSFDGRVDIHGFWAAPTVPSHTPKPDFFGVQFQMVPV